MLLLLVRVLRILTVYYICMTTRPAPLKSSIALLQYLKHAYVYYLHKCTLHECAMHEQIKQRCAVLSDCNTSVMCYLFKTLD
jgi:hypothetical protein